MADASSFRPFEPTAASVAHDPAPLLDVLTVPVPSGRVEPPVDDQHHIFDFHLGLPTQVTCRMEGREQRGLQTQGHCSVVPAGAAHRWMFAESAQALLVRLSPGLFADTADGMGIGRRARDIVPTIQMRDPYIERIGWMLQAEDHDAYPGGRLFTDSLACALAARLIALQSRHDPSPQKSERALPAWRLRRVLDYIEAHLDRDLTLAELAAVAGFSLSHFKPLFKRAVGAPVHRFVLERRVERARMLLMQGQKSRVEIALETGFAHPSHMARSMRRVLGATPAQVAASQN